MNCFVVIASLMVAGAMEAGAEAEAVTPGYGYSPSPAPYVPPTYTPGPYQPEPTPYIQPIVPVGPPEPLAPLGLPGPAAVVPGGPHPGGPLPLPDPKEKLHNLPPLCAKGKNWMNWCLEDEEYPKYDIQKALKVHSEYVRQLYAEVVADTKNSVDRLKELDDETYLCPSETSYIMPKRAINIRGQWRIIVNDVKAHYETLTQTARIEECTTEGSPCPLVPQCYETKCLQKSIYHRFLIYDPYDEYLPFAIESFKLPASCACYNGDYTEPPHK